MVYPAAAVTGNGPQQAAHHCGNGDGGKGHRQGDPGAVDDPGQDVAAHLVGAQPVLDGGGLELQGCVLLNHQRLVVKKHIGKDGEEDDDGQNDESQNGHLVFLQAAPYCGGLGLFLVLVFHFPSHPHHLFAVLYWARILGSR
ncbi:50S ribosomal protein L16, partial [Dysosmobacter welbionis]